MENLTDWLSLLEKIYKNGA